MLCWKIIWRRKSCGEGIAGDDTGFTPSTTGRKWVHLLDAGFDGFSVDSEATTGSSRALRETVTGDRTWDSTFQAAAITEARRAGVGEGCRSITCPAHCDITTTRHRAEGAELGVSLLSTTDIAVFAIISLAT